MRNGIPLFRFSKPKGPGFGLNKGFYLSILATGTTLPSIEEVIRPKGSVPIQGAFSLEGYGVPLVGGDDKSLLALPMRRGQYAIATPKRETVLRLTVVLREEAGFDPELITRSALAEQLPATAIERIRATTSVLQLTVESHDPAVYPAIDFMLSVAQRVAVLTNGVVADPLSQRYLLPEQVVLMPKVDSQVDAREMVAVHFLNQGAHAYVYTRGLQKIVQPELEMRNVPLDDLKSAQSFLMASAQGVFKGRLLKNGSKLPAGIQSFEVREGGTDSNFWGATPVLELVPPTGISVGGLLAAWQSI